MLGSVQHRNHQHLLECLPSLHLQARINAEQQTTTHSICVLKKNLNLKTTSSSEKALEKIPEANFWSMCVELSAVGSPGSKHWVTCSDRLNRPRHD